MQLAERSSTTPNALPDNLSRTLSGLNQNVYQRLKKSLSLNLRRQIFLAVCDDFDLRNRLAAQLYAELAYPTQASALPNPPLPRHSFNRDAALSADRFLTPTLAVEPSLSLSYPRLVSLNLNLGEPDPFGQIAQWLAQYPPPKSFYQQVQPPGFQILGAERLTRQSACAQKQFLTSLQRLEKFLPNFEFSLLLWVSRPWLHAIQQSAPTFWQWRTGLFEFEGDPTPVPTSTFKNPTSPSSASLNHAPSKPAATSIANKGERKSTAGFGTITQTDRPQHPNALSNSQTVHSRPSNNGVAASSKTTPVQPQAPLQAAAVTDDDLWDILTHDLDLLKDGQGQQGNAATPADWDNYQIHSSSSVPATQPAAKSASNTHATAAVLTPSEVPNTAVPVVPIALPYPLHSIQDLANLVMAIAMQERAEAADDHTDLILALEQIQQLHNQQGTETDLAIAYQNLGNLYRDRIEQGDNSEATLMVAICAYELALQWLEPDAVVLPDLLNDIGNLYWMLSRGLSDPAKAQSYLERAIAAYQGGLSQIEPESRSQTYSMIQNNLGSAFGDLARYHSPAAALEQSVWAYEEALRYRTLEEDPARYAATQNNLGTAYWNLAQHHQPVLCLKRAIAAYTEALRYYSAAQEPLYYAMIQNNLGTAFWNLAQHKQAAPDAVEALETGETEKLTLSLSPADWLHRAIAAYQAALTYRTVDAVPAAFAATQNNLGTAHWHLANLSGIQPAERREHLQQAIVAYNAALKAVDHLTKGDTDQAPALTFDPFATHNNLGLAYHQIATDKQAIRDEEATRSSYLELALQHHLQALQGWQQNSDYYQTVFGYIVQTIRTFYSEFGMKGQNLAMSKVPAQLLPEIMKRI